MARKSIHINEQNHADLSAITDRYPVKIVDIVNLFIELGLKMVSEDAGVLSAIIEAKRKPIIPPLDLKTEIERLMKGRKSFSHNEIYAMPYFRKDHNLISSIETLGYRKFFPNSDPTKTIRWTIK